MLFPPSTIKKFHAKILFVAWLCDLSWEVKMFHLFFQGKTSRKFLSLLLIYLPVFLLRISSCHGLSCVHVRASWYEFHCVVCRCGWLKRYLHAAKVQATQVPMLSPFSLFVSVSSFLQYHICMFFLIPSVRSLRFENRLWKVNIDQNWNPLSHYLFQRTLVIYNFISEENVFLFAINLLFIAIRTWN